MEQRIKELEDALEYAINELREWNPNSEAAEHCEYILIENPKYREE